MAIEDADPIPQSAPHYHYPCVSIESPFNAPTDAEKLEFIEFARQCMQDSMMRGEAPFVSHLLYPQVLDDKVPIQRLAGLSLSHAWRLRADKIVLYVDRGISAGMADAKALGEANKIPVEERRLYNG